MTTPTGRLAWGQAGNYDAADDRAVIAAVSGLRTGLVTPLAARPGAGLFVIIEGGWLGIADCGDSTSGVVGARLDLAIEARPGPVTGERLDVIWCDVEPDEGTWELTVITEPEAAGRPGIPLVYLTVPAGATSRRPDGHNAPPSGTSSGGSCGGRPKPTPARSRGDVGHCRHACMDPRPGLPIFPGTGTGSRFKLTRCSRVSGSLAGRIGVGSAPRTRARGADRARAGHLHHVSGLQP